MMFQSNGCLITDVANTYVIYKIINIINIIFLELLKMIRLNMNSVQ